MSKVWKRWVLENPLGMNESLFAMKAYAPYHHLYVVSSFFFQANRMGSMAPTPVKTFERASTSKLIDQIINSTGTCLNSALESAANEPHPPNTSVKQ